MSAFQGWIHEDLGAAPVLMINFTLLSLNTCKSALAYAWFGLVVVETQTQSGDICQTVQTLADAAFMPGLMLLQNKGSYADCAFLGTLTNYRSAVLQYCAHDCTQHITTSTCGLGVEYSLSSCLEHDWLKAS